jgi:hypothetical protein
MLLLERARAAVDMFLVHDYVGVYVCAREYAGRGRGWESIHPSVQSVRGSQGGHLRCLGIDQVVLVGIHLIGEVREALVLVVHIETHLLLLLVHLVYRLHPRVLHLLLHLQGRRRADSADNCRLLETLLLSVRTGEYLRLRALVPHRGLRGLYRRLLQHRGLVQLAAPVGLQGGVTRLLIGYGLVVVRLLHRAHYLVRRG